MLNKIPERHFETAGTVFGLIACLSIATQVYAEFETHAPSTVSRAYAFGFLFIFAFWTLYGARFKRPALWLTNGIAALMQMLLLVAILRK